MADNSILEPCDLYNKEFKDKFNQNVEKYFDELVKKTKTDVEKNRTHVKAYNKLISERDKLTKNSNRTNGFKWLFIILTITAIVLAVLGGLGILSKTKMVRIIVPITGGLLAVLFIFLTVKLGKVVKKLKTLIDKKQTEANKEQKICYETMAKLNASYDWNISSDLMELTTPLIDLDHSFDVNKFCYLREKFGFEDNNDPNCSTNYVKSGNINGNPFVLLNTYNTKMVNKTYTGTLTIHWTTTSYSNGKSTTVHHTETLVATSEHKAPIYFYDTRLVYGCEAAKDLSFTRQPTVKDGITDKEIEKLERHTEKELASISEASIKKGGNFTSLGDAKFEGMFHAYDRDNEQQFRLMFTPLARVNMIKLLRQSPYGDDFYFYKVKSLNYIFSKHSQDINYDITPNMFVDYDIDNARKKFIDINNTFFKGLFFDLAPILSIPLYQQMKTHEYIYNIPYEAYHTKYEQEALANRFDKNLLKDPLSKTDAIIKCDFTSKSDGVDYIDIHAYSYKTVEHVDYVTKLGGDGHLHQVPVKWLEYIPLEKVSKMSLCDENTTREKFNNSNELINKLSSQRRLVYERGLLSLLLLDNSDIKDIRKQILKKDEEK